MKYEEPKMEMILIGTEDIITTSNYLSVPENGGGDHGDDGYMDFGNW